MRKTIVLKQGPQPISEILKEYLTEKMKGEESDKYTQLFNILFKNNEHKKNIKREIKLKKLKKPSSRKL